ncbi:MAG: hypothetical protein HGGPFJEG_02506 [Ignavibacteria bacterium]|nr:hypothetical protein [Ignavibacteria bacterium]
MNSEVCASCGESLTGKYCQKCGEKKFDKSEFTVMNYAGQLLYNLTHFESKIWKSLYLLCFKPGEITINYLKGKRIFYVKPVQFFLLVNIFYFFVLNYVGYDVFTSSPDDYMNKDLMGSIFTALINNKVKSENLSFDEYTMDFYNHNYIQSKLLIILMIPMISLALYFLYPKSKKLFFEHMIYSTHYLTFILFFITVFLNLIFLLAYLIKKLFFNEDSGFIFQNEFGMAVTAITASIYAYLSLKKVYGQSELLTIVKTILFMISLIIITDIYRIILFFTSFYLT